MIRVVHVSSGEHTLYIGRAFKNYPESKWHNPFHIGVDGSRFEVIQMYETYLRESPLWNDLHELDGQVLGCWCKPKECHGDVLRRLRAEQLFKGESTHDLRRMRTETPQD